MQIDPQVVLNHYGQIIGAIAALGTAAYGVVDATKGFYGGVSNVGFPSVAELINFLFHPKGTPAESRAESKYLTKKFDDIQGDGLSTAAILRTLKSNWINGMPGADQRAIAKSLIKLRLDVDDAAHFANIARLKRETLEVVIRKMKAGETLTTEEQNTYGRLDLVLTTLLEQAYQRGDQRYRDTAKLLAVPVSVALAIWGGKVIGIQPDHIWNLVILGLIATPLAPVAKDLTSALTAAVRLAEASRGKK